MTEQLAAYTTDLDLSGVDRQNAVLDAIEDAVAGLIRDAERDGAMQALRQLELALAQAVVDVTRARGRMLQARIATFPGRGAASPQPSPGPLPGALYPSTEE